MNEPGPTLVAEAQRQRQFEVDDLLERLRQTKERPLFGDRECLAFSRSSPFLERLRPLIEHGRGGASHPFDQVVVVTLSPDSGKASWAWKIYITMHHTFRGGYFSGSRSIGSCWGAAVGATCVRTSARRALGAMQKSEEANVPTIPPSVDYELSEARGLLAEFKVYLAKTSHCSVCRTLRPVQSPLISHAPGCPTREITMRLRRFELNFGRLEP